MSSYQILALLLAAFAHPREFHQGVDYRIEASLDEARHVLTGRAWLRYTNHSPRPLDTLYFHLHLNAFRPNSAWAQRELETGERRFQDLGPADHAFDRLRSIVVNGRAAKPVFPFAPDSTVVAVPLSRRIASKGVASVTLSWESRLSTVPRRQGRRGRHYDWAHWYPRIAVYDTAGWHVQPLLPQTEFFGEFASYDVTLDLAADQVIGATGVPVSGDPGWLRTQGTAPPVSSRKRVRWRAEKVHHFAWTADPDFIYERGQHREVALHVLYLPGDTLWPGRVMTTVKSALEFFDTLLGPYAYPQLTTTRRLDRGATEFPMITMHAPSPAVVHETAHEWAHAMLANNEFRDAWLDEGLVGYLGALYSEAAGSTTDWRRSVNAVAVADSARRTQPVATPAAQFRDFNTFALLSYAKASLIFRMLHWLIGDTEFRRGLRLYFENNKLQHVDENDFKTAMEQAAGKDLDWFFQQWLHTTHTLDYAIKAATATRQADGSWRTRIDVMRSGDIWMPVELRVGDRTLRLDSRDYEFSAFVDTAEKPKEAVLDPNGILIDIARSNNFRSID